MTKITFYDKNNNFIKTIEPTKDEMFNKILKRPKSLLDLGLDNDVDIKFSCMGGSCSACKCSILKGDNLINKQGLNKQIYKDVKKDEILSCISTIRELNPNDEIKIKLLL